MTRELAAAFARGASRSTAAEARKAALRPHTNLVLASPPAHRRRFLTIRSTSPPDAAHLRRNASPPPPPPPHGLVYSCSRRHDLLPTNNPRSSRFLAGAPWRHAGGAYSDRSETSLRATFSEHFYMYTKAPLRPSAGSTTGVPKLGKLAKISQCCLILHKNGRLVPPPKVDKGMVAFKFILLSLGLLAGYLASKDHSKLAFMLKVCDGSMKIYKVLAEIVDILSAFVK